MDANGLGFQLLHGAAHWRLLQDPSGLEYDRQRRSLRLAQQRREVSFADNPVLAGERLELTPQTLDDYGNRARLDPGGEAILASGPAGEIEVYRAATGALISDMAMGYDDVLYVVVDGRVVMQDRRERWDPVNHEVPAVAGFHAWRLAADPRGGAWVLDRDHKRLARLRGQPLHRLARPNPGPDHASQCAANADAPRITVLEQASWPDSQSPVALACNPQGRVAVLTWDQGEDALLRQLDDAGALLPGVRLRGAANPYSMAWVGDSRVALLLAGIGNEAPVYRIDSAQTATWPVGDLYPLKPDFANGPFVHGLQATPHYPTVDSSRALHRLSFPFYSRSGEATNDPLRAPLDGGRANMAWHRLYLEAVIPRGCGIKVWLAASDDAAGASILPEHWYEHRFGAAFANPARGDIPIAAWESIPSEIPHHPGLLPCPPRAGQSGLFSVLIQRSTRRVRTLRGRYLQVQVQLTGEGRETPEIFALRAYGERFSYIDEYLPQLYRESLYRPEADQQGDATAADFFGRYVTNFEGLLTVLEDRIANAHLLTDPASAPATALPWIGSWIGHDVNPSLPESVQRDFLLAAAELDRWHGTLRGLKLALEIATRGAVSGGEIVVLEDFRLRRTFASIIGADLVDDDDPLTLGANISGNAFVGDTLFVGDENNREFLALFGADLEVDSAEREAIERLFERLAFRVTILVHESVEPQDLGLIHSIAQRETPAHVEFRILSASNRFLVGMAALVGVDSYLAGKVPPASARVGAARLGKNHYVKGPGALDARLRDLGSGTPDTSERAPVAFAPDVSAGFGSDVLLDGSESRAFGGRNLTNYNWEYNREGD